MTSQRKGAIVTGAARPWGMGRATALGLAEHGMDIVIADVRDDWGQEAVTAVKEKTGKDAIYVQTDISQRANVEAMVELAVKEFGRIDVLANIAGIVEMAGIDDITDEHFDRLINVNLRGTILTCQAVVPYMRKQGGGRIVNTASGGAFQPLKGGLGVYGASKAGVVIFSKNLALELAPDNISVITVAPGPTNTAMGAEQGPSEPAEGMQARSTPFNRSLAAEEVAEVMIYAAISESNALSGQTLHANLGTHMV